MKPNLITDSSPWAERYEAVREHLLSGRQILGADPVGLVLLLKHGMAGWMRRWIEGLAETRSVRATPVGTLCLATPIWQQQLTLLLAQMAVSQLHPTAAS
jgi:hypothetical protein